MPWAVPEEEKQPRVLDLISALSENCLFPICLKVRHGCGNGIKKKKIQHCVLKAWQHWNCDFSGLWMALMIQAVVLASHFVWLSWAVTWYLFLIQTRLERAQPCQKLPLHLDWNWQKCRHQDVTTKGWGRTLSQKCAYHRAWELGFQGQQPHESQTWETCL